jgi:hypothetical protein
MLKSDKEDKGLEKELVTGKKSDYLDFVNAFNSAAKEISKGTRIDLAWKQLHLFQLLQRDLMAWAFGKESDEEKKKIYKPLFEALECFVCGILKGNILERMSTSVFVTWLKMAGQLRKSDPQIVDRVKPHIEAALRTPILGIADSLWRFQGHSLAGAGDLGCDSFGVEAFAFVSALKTCQQELGLGLEELANKHEITLNNLSTSQSYIPYLLLRDWRGLSYALDARDDELDRELARAFALRTVDSVTRSGISDERTWYLSIREMFD